MGTAAQPAASAGGKIADVACLPSTDGRSVGRGGGLPGGELLGIACITTAFDGVNRAGAAYDVRTVAPGGRAVSCRSGLTLRCQGALERVRGR